MLPLVILSVTVLFSAVLHRVTGIGFSLAATPVVVITYGVDSGLVLVGLAGLLSSALTLAVSWRDFRIRQAAPFVGIVIAVALPVMWFSRLAPTGWPQFLAGAGGIIAVALIVRPAPFYRRLMARRSVAGWFSGALIGLAGLGGPPAAVHALAASWGRSTVPNLQFLFVIASMLVLAVRGTHATFSKWDAMAALSAVVAGAILGQVVSRRVSAVASTRLMIGVAALGSIAALIDGVRMQLAS